MSDEAVKPASIKSAAAASSVSGAKCSLSQVNLCIKKKCTRRGWVILKRREDYSVSIKDEAKVRVCAAPPCDVYQVPRLPPTTWRRAYCNEARVAVGIEQHVRQAELEVTSPPAAF